MNDNKEKSDEKNEDEPQKPQSPQSTENSPKTQIQIENGIGQKGIGLILNLEPLRCIDVDMLVSVRFYKFTFVNLVGRALFRFSVDSMDHDSKIKACKLEIENLKVCL